MPRVAQLTAQGAFQGYEAGSDGPRGENPGGVLLVVVAAVVALFCGAFLTGRAFSARLVVPAVFH